MPVRKIYGFTRRPGMTRTPLRDWELKKVQFVELYPLVLQNKIERKFEKEADTSCLQEMAIMFACMKQQDFKEVKCSEEINTFNKCYAEYKKNKKEKKAREASGEIITGTNSRNLTVKQLNQLLQKYPQFNEKIK